MRFSPRKKKCAHLFQSLDARRRSNWNSIKSRRCKEKMYIAHVTINVNDQERAKEFYTKKLGWGVQMDAPMGDGGRWLTVVPPGEKTAFVLAKGMGDWSPDK